MLLYTIVFSQSGFSVNYEADYKLIYKDQNKANARIQESAFALLINSKESYFKNMNKYISDSLKFEKKLSSTGNKINDVNNLLKYFTDFNENIGLTSSKIYVTVPIEDKNYYYIEKNELNWKVLDETKNILGYNCQKAIVTKYGRNWIAYFTQEIPFSFGPYKFSGLPGLIVEIYDDQKDYCFTIYRFQKRKYYCKSANISVNPILIEKQKIFNFKKKQIENTTKIQQGIDDPETRAWLVKKSQERAKVFNPIELKID